MRNLTARQGMTKPQTHADASANPPHDPLAFIDWRTLAARMGVHPRSIRKWTGEGLPCYRISPRITRYRWPEVQGWLASRREGGVL